MPPSPKLYVRHRRDRRLYDAYLRHLQRPKWRSYTSAKYDPDVPLTTPSFGSAVAWIRRNRHVINGVVLLLKLYPHVIRDDSLNSLWEFMEPYLSVCALHTNRRSSSDSDLSATCRSVLSTPAFVEISFPVTPGTKLPTSRNSYNNSPRLARSANALRKDTNKTKARHQTPDVISLSNLPTSPCTNLTPNKYRNGCISPIASYEPHRLVPPSLSLTPVARYIQQQEQQEEEQQQQQDEALRPVVTTTGQDLRPVLPPVRTTGNKTVSKTDDSVQRHPSAPAQSPSLTRNTESTRRRASGHEKTDQLYTRTRYLIARSNSFSQLKLVNWPPRSEELAPNIDYMSEDSEDFESCYLLNNENADIDLWSDTPVDGLEGELT